jgi:hypothetical protein
MPRDSFLFHISQGRKDEACDWNEEIVQYLLAFEWCEICAELRVYSQESCRGMNWVLRVLRSAEKLPYEAD